MTIFKISYIIKMYVLIFLVLCFLLLWGGKDSVNMLLFVNILVVLSFSSIVLINYKRSESLLTTKSLALTTFLYSIIVMLLYYGLSIYYNDDIFVFCYSDAQLYYDTVVRMYSDNSGNPYGNISLWAIDDWGAPVSMFFLYSLIPSKVFVNFGFVILGTISTVSLFSIGKNVMPKRYAYIGALTFGISSYWIFYHSSFLKESIMVFIVIESFYFFYKFIKTRSILYLILAVLCSILLLFFRPALIVFMWLACSTFLVLNKKGRLFFIIVFAIVLSFMLTHITDIFDNYTHSGDVETIKTYIDATPFSIVTNAVGALVGPFPNLISATADIAYKHLYGPGLLLKYMLFVPFWYGAFYAIRKKQLTIIPLFAFCIIEIVSLIFINNGMVLRKAVPHVPLYVLCSFWMISQINCTKNFKSKFFFIRLVKASWIIVFISTLAWNTLT